MAKQWLAAASKCVQRGIRAGAATRQVAPSQLLARAFASTPHPSETFLTGSNNAYVEEMYSSWKSNPQSVHKSWDVYFRQVESGAVPGEAFIPPPTIQKGVTPVRSVGAAAAAAAGTSDYNDALGLSYLIRAYQVRGHEGANLDPLGLQQRPDLPELDIKMYGFTDADLDRVIAIPKNFSSGVSGFLEELADGREMTLGEIVRRLKETYCSTIGVQYMHMLNRDQCNWIRTKVEHLVKEEDSKAKRMHILERLAFSVVFERFLGNKYNTTKRFGLDGAESLIPGMKFLIDRATELGMEHLVIGMPHRGRLNVLSNVIRKPIQQIFKEFQGTHFDVEAYRAESDVEDWSNSGDVKYHLGTSYDRAYPDGRQVHLSLVANPSHLEAVDPVVVGKVRAKQFYLGNDDEAERKVMPMLLHGDAAFSGQGVVYETMHLSGLDNYDTGGTVHVVVNNQIGFTTDPKNSRSSQYCTDLGKAMDVPILHVNGDDPEAVVKVFEFAAEWRQQWRSDVIINLTCYRRFGHNEIDNPFFTQPIMYKKIGQMQSVLDLYVQKLVATNAASQQECNAVVDKVNQFFQSTFEESNEWEPMKKSDWLANRWESFKSPNQQSRIRPTGVSLDLLKHVGDKICATPEGFKLNRQLQRIIGAKKATIEAGEGIDWGTAEALAWGTLLLEGNHVRISGQDVERGTFSHRHAVLHDQETNDEFVPLNSLAPRTLKSAPLEYKPLGNEVPDTQAEFVASNSSLSEFGVLGFELGYSLENPNALVMWEAQFGDFANGAQIMIDQFLSAGEDKWMRQSGLVMLLPHGYEGQGAEHSSCRVERFLQMTDDEPDVVPVMDEDNRMQIQHTNWQVVYCSTPAQYFHVLRRQLHREFRKPLISVQPKHLLRLRQAASKVEDMAEGTKFHRLLPEVSTSLVADASVKRVVFCSGKVYYDMVAERDARGINDIALVRVEQIAPFPFDKVAEQAARYSNAEIVWAQEEPHNMGFWTYVSPRIETALTKINGDSARRPRYIGRPPAAAPATGYNAVHQIEQARIVDKALA